MTHNTIASLPPVVAGHIDAVNAHDEDAIVATFAADALVNDAHREFWGTEAIRAFMAKEFAGDRVTMEVREVIDHYGVVSEETARAMAHAVRERLGADYGIGITGVAGPEKQEDKPVGTAYIVIEGPDGVVAGVGPGFRASREDNKRLVTLAALNLLRLHLEGIIKAKK